MALNDAGVARCMAEIEAVSGVAETFAPATDAFLAYVNENPAAFEVEESSIEPIRETRTPSTSTIGRSTRRFTPTIVLQGSGTPGTAVRFNDMIRSSLIEENAAASSVVYTPRTTTPESATCALDADGQTMKGHGMIGTFRMSGQNGQGVEIAFDHQGVLDELVNTSEFSGWAANSNLAQPFQAADGHIDNGTVDWDKDTASNPLLIKSFSFDRGLSIGPIGDANSADGVYSIGYERGSTPSLELVIGMHNTLTSLINPEADIRAQTTHDVYFTVGSGAGKEWLLQWPEAQPVGWSIGTGDGGKRTATIRYKVQSATEGGEFTFTSS